MNMELEHGQRLGHRLWMAFVALGAIGGLALVSEVRAQEPMTSGILDYVSPEDGTIRLRADQIASRPLIFYGMHSANVMTVSGRLARLEDLAPGMSVSLFFARHGKRKWIISRVVVADEEFGPGQIMSGLLWQREIRHDNGK